MTDCAVVGLGKLGACMAAAIASRGARVTGVDVNGAVVDLLTRGLAPVVEPGLQELVTAHHDRIRATTSFAEAVAASDLTFVVVPTPSEPDGSFSTRFVASAFESLGRALAATRRGHTIVLVSTVLPGVTRQLLVPLLEGASGRQVGGDLHVCYSPEFIALGSVIHDFLEPDFVLVGEHDELGGEVLSRFYGEILPNEVPVRRMTLENAELAKVSLNSYVTMKISFANMLAELAERLPGGDVDAVTSAIGLDRRIGRRYLTGALGFGGPCFPRDNNALASFARSMGVPAHLPDATDRANAHVLDRVADQVVPLAGPGRTVAVLGLAYKPGTPVTERSQSLELARILAGTGADVVTFDPLAHDEATARPLDDCLARADVIVVANPDPAFRDMRSDHWGRVRRGATVIDCWRILDADALAAAGIRYIPVGRNGAGVADTLTQVPA